MYKKMNGDFFFVQNIFLRPIVLFPLKINNILLYFLLSAADRLFWGCTLFYLSCRDIIERSFDLSQFIILYWDIPYRALPYTP